MKYIKTKKLFKNNEITELDYSDQNLTELPNIKTKPIFESNTEINELNIFERCDELTIDLFKKYIEDGYNPNITDERNRTLLYNIYSKNANLSYEEHKKKNKLFYFILNYIDLNIKCVNGDYFILNLIKIDDVLILIEHGADIRVSYDTYDIFNLFVWSNINKHSLINRCSSQYFIDKYWYNYNNELHFNMHLLISEKFPKQYKLYNMGNKIKEFNI